MKLGGPVEAVYLLAVIFGILTILFLMGKGSSLIPGNNTALTKKQDRFDKKKLCRGIGVCFGALEVFLIITAVFWDSLPGWYGILFLVVVAVGLLVTGFLVNANMIAGKQQKTDTEHEKQ
ncbi:MAG: DUF3784 domain-containing protein [Lachnospiraceae bacterium]